MFRISLADTIIAVSTPPGPGGIGIVRLSGPEALSIASAFFVPLRTVPRFPVRRAVFGRLVDPEGGTAFDEAILTYFRKPRSYTREDVVEISGHGSPFVLDRAVRLGIAAGARPAQPGEFTLRAHLNGRYDIIQAEAVNDLIRAESPAAARLAYTQIEGGLSRKVRALRRSIIELLAGLEAAVEFPDEDLGVTKAGTAASIKGLEAEIADLVSSYDAGRSLREGVAIAIVGRPNAGKSTLFNALVGEDRAIVAPEAGTTRDYLRERIRIKDLPFTFIDMAGFGRASSGVEKEGLRKARHIAGRADGILLLLDASKKAVAADLVLLEEYRGRKAILVFNKLDLPRNMDVRAVKKIFRGPASIEISARDGTNIRKLRGLIHETFGPRVPDGSVVIFHERQKHLLEAVLARLRLGLKEFEAGASEEICAEEIREAVLLIGNLTGEIGADEILADIFGRFCVGK